MKQFIDLRFPINWFQYGHPDSAHTWFSSAGLFLCKKGGDHRPFGRNYAMLFLSVPKQLEHTRGRKCFVKITHINAMISKVEWPLQYPCLQLLDALVRSKEAWSSRSSRDQMSPVDYRWCKRIRMKKIRKARRGVAWDNIGRYEESNGMF